MTASVSNIIAGPAKLLIEDADMGHTEGGVSATISPKTRMRTVDQFGQSPVAVIHQGDEVKVEGTLAEYIAACIAEVYAAGRNQLSAVTNKYLGVGRSAGFLYTGQDLKLTPHLSSDSAKKVQLFNAVPVGELVLTMNNEADRLLKMTWQGLVDESRTDGELIGAIITAGSVS